jgi:hypothetical protein
VEPLLGILGDSRHWPGRFRQKVSPRPFLTESRFGSMGSGCRHSAPPATQPPDFVAQGPGCGWNVTWGAKGTGELQGSSTLDSLLSSLVGP